VLEVETHHELNDDFEMHFEELSKIESEPECSSGCGFIRLRATAALG